MQECGRCRNGSKRCGERVICVEDYCALDGNSDSSDDNTDSTVDADDDKKSLVTEEECGKMCDRFWCKKDQLCLSRNNQLQGKEP